MSNSLSQRHPGFDKLFQTVFRRPLPLQRESALFLFVSVLDLLMTYLLLAFYSAAEERATFYESNPVAGYFLATWGISGIVYFKFVMVAIVEVLAQIVAMEKIVVGRRVLEFGTLAVSSVVIYSMVLLLSHQ